jgi:putative protease
MELLAPAGSLAVFQTAIAAGADAVYVGAPALNARALGHDFSRGELAAMTAHAHEGGKKLYVAMNSLCKEQELSRAVETLAMLAELRVDGLILQDLGVWRLA